MSRRIKISELEDAPDVRQFWSPDEKIILVTYYGVKNTLAIAKYLGKTYVSVRSMVQAKGLKFTMTQEERDEMIRKIREGIE